MMMTNGSEQSIISATDKDFLNGVGGFVDRYIHNLAYYTKCEEAYERTEAQYVALIGQRRYKTYDSFRVAMSRYFNK